MPIKINKISKLKVLRHLQDMQPRWISMVDHGATQIPFHVVKRDKPVSHGGKIMSNCIIKRMEFEKSSMAKDELVQYLKNLGFDTDSIEETDNTYFMKNDIDESTVEKEATIDGPVSGSVFTIVKVKSDEQDGSNDTNKKTEKSIDSMNKKVDDRVKNTDSNKKVSNKFDLWNAVFSNETSFGGCIDDANDGLPIGMEEITRTMITAISNSLRDGQKDNVAPILTDYGKAILFLNQFYEIFGESPSDSNNGKNQKKEIPMSDETKKVDEKTEEKEKAPVSQETKTEPAQEVKDKNDASGMDKMDQILSILTQMDKRLTTLETPPQDEKKEKSEEVEGRKSDDEPAKDTDEQKVFDKRSDTEKEADRKLEERLRKDLFGIR